MSQQIGKTAISAPSKVGNWAPDMLPTTGIPTLDARGNDQNGLKIIQYIWTQACPRPMEIYLGHHCAARAESHRAGGEVGGKAQLSIPKQARLSCPQEVHWGEAGEALHCSGDSGTRRVKGLDSDQLGFSRPLLQPA